MPYRTRSVSVFAKHAAFILRGNARAAFCAIVKRHAGIDGDLHRLHRAAMRTSYIPNRRVHKNEKLKITSLRVFRKRQLFKSPQALVLRTIQMSNRPALFDKCDCLAQRHARAD